MELWLERFVTLASPADTFFLPYLTSWDCAGVPNDVSRVSDCGSAPGSSQTFEVQEPLTGGTFALNPPHESKQEHYDHEYPGIRKMFFFLRKVCKNKKILRMEFWNSSCIFPREKKVWFLQLHDWQSPEYQMNKNVAYFWGKKSQCYDKFIFFIFFFF